ncbi:MAG: MBL fold metallo-hydrolase [Lachnospiraceae bacterium]|nr:MBL fold metallo-hydrolase [Lachnospiraceae bacterium]
MKIKEYFGYGAVMTLFLCALLFFLAMREKERSLKIYLVYLGIVAVGMLNPLTVYVLDKTNNLTVFERFFWLMLSPVCLAAAGGVIGKGKRMLTICLPLLLLLCGRSVFTEIEYQKAENACKISKEAIEVSDIIMRDYEGLPADAKIEPNRRGFENSKRPRAAITEPLCGEVRMYNSNIDLWYVRKGFGNAKTHRYKKVANYLSLSNEEIPVKKLIKKLYQRDFRYFVLGDWQTLTGKVGIYDIQQIGRAGRYTVYKYTPKGLISIRHFSNEEDLGCMSYLIKLYSGELIVVDGGRPSMSLQLTDAIKEEGGHVKAWIITHPHDDHAGVLASILEAEWDKSEITIDQIYLGEWDWDAVNEQNLRTDFVYYLKSNLDKRDNVTYLKTGDVVELGEKYHIRVLHTCNETVTENSGNILNDGSMVFLLQSVKEDMLFLGDIGDNNPSLRADEGITDDKIGEGSKMGRLLADEILAQLTEKDLKRIRILQVSHHGNNLMPDYFYEKISPKLAYFDAPDWLMNNRMKDTGEKGSYTTPHYRDLMKKIGASIVSYYEDKEYTLE